MNVVNTDDRPDHRPGLLGRRRFLLLLPLPLLLVGLAALAHSLGAGPGRLGPSRSSSASGSAWCCR